MDLPLNSGCFFLLVIPYKVWIDYMFGGGVKDQYRLSCVGDINIA